MENALRLMAGHAQLFDLILEKQFFSLQFDDVKIVHAGMRLFRFDLFFESFVTALKFCKMALHRHPAIPFEIADDCKSVHETKHARKRKTHLG